MTLTERHSHACQLTGISCDLLGRLGQGSVRLDRVMNIHETREIQVIEYSGETLVTGNTINIPGTFLLEHLNHPADLANPAVARLILHLSAPDDICYWGHGLWITVRLPSDHDHGMLFRHPVTPAQRHPAKRKIFNEINQEHDITNTGSNNVKIQELMTRLHAEDRDASPLKDWHITRSSRKIIPIT